jgi:hypothetical protein
MHSPSRQWGEGSDGSGGGGEIPGSGNGGGGSPPGAEDDNQDQRNTGDPNPPVGSTGLEAEQGPPPAVRGEVQCESQFSDSSFDTWRAVEDASGFVSGLLAGFWEQIEDVWDVITDLGGTWETLKDLAAAVIDDPAAVAEAFADEIGNDVKKLTDCGPYDKGKVIGQYVSPAIAVKVATKLAKFGGDIRKAVDEVKKEDKKKDDDTTECASFAAGTLITTPNGLVSIETLVSGATVESRFESTFKDANQPITRTFGRTAPSYHVLGTEFDTLKVTEEHPFYVQGQGWTRAADLARGDAIVTQTGDVLVYSNVKIERSTEVFNFSVDQSKSYFVGEYGVWAHNASGECDITKRVPDKQLLDVEVNRLLSEGHAIQRHGGAVTDQQLITRALTGRAPDGSIRLNPKTGDPILPPMSSAFHSDELLVLAEQTLRKKHLQKAIALSPGQNIIRLNGIDLGFDLGRGFSRIGSSKFRPDLQGPPQLIDNLQKVDAVFKYDANTGKWVTDTIFPTR